MKKIFIILLLSVLFTYCTTDTPKQDTSTSQGIVSSSHDESTDKSTPAPEGLKYNFGESPEDLKRKLDNLRPQNHTPTEPLEIKKVNLSPQLSTTMVNKGKVTFRKKCQSCHSLTEAKGPKASGLKKVLNHRRPAWFINMTTAVPKDMGASPEENTQLNQCPTRKYDTRLSFVESRDMLELLLSLK